MDVLKRRMFQDGGVVGPQLPNKSKVLSRRVVDLGYRNPYQQVIQIEQQGDLFFERVYRNGRLKKERLIERGLSPTGNLQEALDRQKINEMVRGVVETAPYAVGAGVGTVGAKTAFGTTAGKQFLKGAGSGIEKAGKGILNFLTPYKLNPKFVKGKDGKSKLVERGATENFPPQSLSQIQMKPVTTGVYGVSATSAAVDPLVDALTTTPEEVQEQFEQQILDSDMSELEKMKAIESARAQKDPVAYAQSIADFDADLDAILEEETPTPTPTPAPTPAPTPEPTPAPGPQAAANSLSNFFSSSAFNDALRNIGSSLVREGRFGAGLAAGAASFAEEQEAKSLLEQERLRELSLIAAEKANQGISTSEAKNNAEFNAKANNAVTDFNKTSNNLARLQYAISKVDETAVGFKGLFGKGFEMLQSFTNQNYNKNFENLDSRTQVDAIVNALRQENIRDILGESGRTISNLDREIVAEIFGSIKSTTSAAEIKSKLREIEKRFRNSLEKSKNEILETVDYFGQTGMTSSSLLANAERIKDILNIEDYSKYSPPVYNPSGSLVVDSGAKGARVTSVDYTTSGG